MKPLPILLVAATVTAHATDHNNIDSGRPSRFDDAYSIAYRERSIETGLTLDVARHRSSVYGFKTEYKVGYAKNRDVGISFEPNYAATTRLVNANNIELSYFEGVRREIGAQPALAYRVDLGLPTGRNSRGVDVRFRAIATRATGRYDRLHLNLDATLASSPQLGERKLRLGAVLGYSCPLGYPTRFDRTLVAELAFEQSPDRATGSTGSIGLGIRQQTGPRSVVDFGIRTDVTGTRGSGPRTTQLGFGFSYSL